ncbi:MAG TPA: glycosyltransferase [Oligoflexia bacterium]|nr:glycosyltransferase [Oligoflexia bacterium]HMP27280.1 glycosyltransferase [Oligoflexia bacterium]
MTKQERPHNHNPHNHNPSHDHRRIISVVLPVYKNKDSLLNLRERLTTTLNRAKIQHELVFVQDACPLDSVLVLEKNPPPDREQDIKIIRLPQNRGQHQALIKGLATANGNYFVTMDADLQDRPEDLPRLYNEITSRNVACVFAGRTGTYQQSSRHLTSRVFKALHSTIIGVPQNAGAFLIVNKLLRDFIVKAAPHVEKPHIVSLIGVSRLPTISIPIERDIREKGVSAYSGWGRLKLGVRSILTAVSLRRQGRKLRELYLKTKE